MLRKLALLASLLVSASAQADSTSPEDLCYGFWCPFSQVCNVGDDGKPFCVETNPCAGNSCAKEETCIVSNEGGPACLPNDVSPCFTMECPFGTWCREDNDGKGQCVGMGPCLQQQCKSNSWCVVLSPDEAVCSESDHPCLDPIFECDANSFCIVNITNQIECVPVNPCLVANCPEDTKCLRDLSTNTPSCVSFVDYVPCSDVTCPEGSVCFVDGSDQPQCTDKNNHPCADKECAYGSWCVISTVTHKPECVNIDPCIHINCPADTWCSVDGTNHATCVAHSPCIEGQSHCAQGSWCITDVKGSIQCIPVNPCGSVSCPEGEKCVVDPNNKGMCAPENIDPCLDDPWVCPKETTCFVNDLHEAACVPNAENPCFGGTECPFGTVCEVGDDGNAVCVDVDVCLHMECPEGTWCEVTEKSAQCSSKSPCTSPDAWCPPGTWCMRSASNEAECVRVDPCRGVTCPDGKKCAVNATNYANCIDFMYWDPCTSDPFVCPPETRCLANGNTADCLAFSDNPCKDVECATGSWCVLNEGQGTCVDIKPCVVPERLCTDGTYCDVQSSDYAVCLHKSLCLDYLCNDGWYCVINAMDGLPQCVPVDPCMITCPEKECTISESWEPLCNGESPPAVSREGCAVVQCPDDQTCVINDQNQEVCAPRDPCQGAQCNPGYACTISEETGEALCVANPCLNFHACPYGSWCIVSPQGQPECVNLDPCMQMNCPDDTWCTVDDANHATCVAHSPCIEGQNNCQAGSWCFINPFGETDCIQVNPCLPMKCNEGERCAINSNNKAFCVPENADPCKEEAWVCDEGSTCFVNMNHEAECVQNDENPCLGSDATACSFGSVCEVSDGAATCVEVEACLHMACPKGTWCEVDPKKVPRCVSKSPCVDTDLVCPSGTWCVRTVTNEAECLPVDPCLEKKCEEDQVCEVLDSSNKPTCVTRPSTGCVDNECPPFHACGVQGCEPTPESPCRDTTCPTGSFCYIDIETGDGQCITTQSCSEVDCGAEEWCQPGPMGPSCRARHPCLGVQACPSDMRCVANATNIPVCVPMTGSSACGLCVAGQHCSETALGEAICVPDIDPCETHSCEEGMYCFSGMDGKAECVPNTGVDPCDGITCSEGMRCLVGTYRSPMCTAQRNVTEMCSADTCPANQRCFVNGWNVTACSTALAAGDSPPDSDDGGAGAAVFVVVSLVVIVGAVGVLFFVKNRVGESKDMGAATPSSPYSRYSGVSAEDTHHQAFIPQATDMDGVEMDMAS